jgi:hypothetical protein
VVATRHDLHSLVDHRRDPERIHRATGAYRRSRDGRQRESA